MELVSLLRVLVSKVFCRILMCDIMMQQLLAFVQLYIQNPEECINPAHLFSDCTHKYMQHKHEDPEILKIYRVKASHYRKSTTTLPIIFMVRLKKGAKPVYMNYQMLKQNHPYVLIEFFEKRSLFRQNQEEEKDFSSPPVYHETPIEIKQLYTESKKQQTDGTSRGRKMRPEQKKEHSLSMDSRPRRSCRLRSDYIQEKSQQHKESYNQSNSINPGKQQSEESGSESQKEQQTKTQLKKILDYDYLVQSSFCLNLISPAVIPTIRTKPEVILAPPLIPYSIPNRINFKQFDRQQYSSEEFKESEESQFVLDQRGKEKRRRQKLLREQERLQKKKKSRRIKKKNKSSSQNKR